MDGDPCSFAASRCRCRRPNLPMSHSLIFKSRTCEFQGTCRCGGSPVRLSVQVGEADEPMVAVGTALEQLKNGVRSSGFSIRQLLPVAQSHRVAIVSWPLSNYKVLMHTPST